MKARGFVQLPLVLSVIGTAALFAPPSAHSQDATPPTTTLHVKSRLVSLDVVVTDDQGRPWPGLKKEDFTIYEDNKVQIIKNFDSWEKRPEIPDKATIDHYGRPDWGDTPLAILVLDEISTQFSDSAYAAEMLKKYLKAQPALLPVPTMLMAVADAGYKTLAVYTRDRDTILTALEKRPPVLPSRAMRGDNDVIMVQTFLVLGQIALAEAGMNQHKSIIWVGPGFPALDPTILDEKSGDSLKKAIRQTVDMLVDTKTTVYKIDPVATTTSTAPEVDQAASLDAGSSDADASAAVEDPLVADNFNFNTFAVETGGYYFYGQNDLDRYFKRAIQQTDQFYTLTYIPPLSDEDGTDVYRNLKVTVDSPPGLHVTTRTGFYSGVPPEPPPTAKDLGVSLSSVASGDMSFTGVGIHLLSVEASKTKPGDASLTFEVENRSLEWTEASNGVYSADAQAVLIGFDSKHNILSQVAYRLHPGLLPKDAALRQTNSLTVRDDLPLEAKTAMIRLIVHDSSGRIGTTDIPAAQFQNILPTGKRR